jgi:hypothetical protein
MLVRFDPHFVDGSALMTKDALVTDGMLFGSKLPATDATDANQGSDTDPVDSRSAPTGPDWKASPARPACSESDSNAPPGELPLPPEGLHASAQAGAGRTSRRERRSGTEAEPAEPEVTTGIATRSPLCGDRFVLHADRLEWGGQCAYLFPKELLAAQVAVAADDLDACRLIFDMARGSY